MPKRSSPAARNDLLRAASRLNKLGINQGTSGNVSLRAGDGFLIPPSALRYDDMQPADLVMLAPDGTPQGRRRPSSEWRIHRDIYAAQPDVQAIVHAHPPQATALACLRREIPAFHYMIAVAGGDSIRCAPYALYGTQQLSDGALTALEGRTACLLANHGILVLGADLDAALDLAVEVEALATQYLGALQVGEPALLSAEEMAAVLESFSEYRLLS